MAIPLSGLTLDELGEIAAQKLGREVSLLRNLELEEFRAHMRRSNDPQRRYVINFLRGTLFREGGGHLEEKDLVLVLDVNAEPAGPGARPSHRCPAA